MTLKEFEKVTQEIKETEKRITKLKEFARETTEIVNRESWKKILIGFWDPETENEVEFNFPAELVIEMTEKYINTLNEEYANMIAKLNECGLKIECDKTL